MTEHLPSILVTKNISYIGARMREPSTYNALAILLAVAGVNVGSPLWAAVAGVGTAVGALLGVLLPEGGATTSMPVTTPMSVPVPVTVAVPLSLQERLQSNA